MQSIEPATGRYIVGCKINLDPWEGIRWNPERTTGYLAFSCPRKSSSLRLRTAGLSRCRDSSNDAMLSSSQYRYASGTSMTFAMSLAVGSGGSCTPNSYRLILARLLDSSIPISTPTRSCDQPITSRKALILRPTTEGGNETSIGMSRVS
jgi:hypothetical protein